MSASLAFAIEAPNGHPESHSRHIEIVTTREQRRARPRVLYAVITVGGLFGLFLVQLLLSIVIAGGAYQISDLQVQQRELVREQDALVETLNLMASPQSLAAKAESLGMVLGTSTPAFLRLSDGTIVGAAGTNASGGAAFGSQGNLVPNILLNQLAAAGKQPGEQPGVVLAAAGAPNVSPASSSVASKMTTLPSPITR